MFHSPSNTARPVTFCHISISYVDNLNILAEVLIIEFDHTMLKSPVLVRSLKLSNFVSTWMGDRLGIQGVELTCLVSLCLLCQAGVMASKTTNEHVYHGPVLSQKS